MKVHPHLIITFEISATHLSIITLFSILHETDVFGSKEIPQVTEK